MLGKHLCDRLSASNVEYYSTDIEVDITDQEAVKYFYQIKLFTGL